jgi:hypothetical protein
VSPEEIRTAALSMAVQAQAARGISDPRQIVTLADLYEVYIRLGGEAARAWAAQK